MQPIYLACFKRDRFHCRHCNSTEGLHPHHIIYRSHQGPDELNNLITLCWQCHRAHHDGKLHIAIVEILANDIVVQFLRKKGWKPV